MNEEVRPQDKARRFFADMSEELFKLWIIPHVESNGWPFIGHETVITDLVWAKYLRDHPPSYWLKVQWQLISVPFIDVKIEARAINLAKQLADVGWYFRETGIVKPTLVRDSPRKVSALASIVENIKKFPKPLVCLTQGNEWLLLDGHHRLGAMFMLENRNNLTFNTWLGKHIPNR